MPKSRHCAENKHASERNFIGPRRKNKTLHGLNGVFKTVLVASATRPSNLPTAGTRTGPPC